MIINLYILCGSSFSLLLPCLHAFRLNLIFVKSEISPPGFSSQLCNHSWVLWTIISKDIISILPQILKFKSICPSGQQPKKLCDSMTVLIILFRLCVYQRWYIKGSTKLLEGSWNSIHSKRSLLNRNRKWYSHRFTQHSRSYDL